MQENEFVQLRDSTVRYLDGIMCRDPKGIEYWYARQLQGLLGYVQWRSFKTAIDRAKMACESVGGKPEHHFADVSKMVFLGSDAKRQIEDVILTRYACYLIAMNGDPAKPEVAAAQTYFAVQTRKYELAHQRDETEQRIVLRDRVRYANKELNSAAKEAGVSNYAFFHDAGYKGLYGLRLSDIKRVKGIQQKEELLDRAGRAELAANEFRITQTELRIRNQEAEGQQEAETVHNYVGKEVRKAIQKLSGTLPENLPPAPPITQLRKQKRAKAPPPSP